MRKAHSFGCTFLLALFSLVASPICIALDSLDANSAAGIKQIPMIDSAQLVESDRTQVDRYRIVLSELKRTSATTYAEQEILVGGQLHNRLWSLPRQYQLPEVIDYFQQIAKTYRVIYQCTGLDCGSSHYWANQVFDNPQLVTREMDKHYLVLQRPLEQGYEITTIYIARRATRQILVNIDQLVVEDPLSVELVSEQQVEKLLRDQQGWLPGLVMKRDSGNQFMIDQARSQTLINQLTQLSGPDRDHLQLVVHCYASTSMIDNISCSEKIADQLRLLTFNQLTQLNIFGQGALVFTPEESLQPALRFMYWPPRR